MKLIVHIGTHKTGSTALQQFLHANRESLAASGIHYATPRRGVHNSNSVANALNLDENGAVRTFFAKQVESARRRRAHTILVSAENFYAMSVLDALQRKTICTNAPERDQVLIEALRSLLPHDIVAPRIVCYVRRPDHYAESLYSEQVKRGVVFDGTFDEFLPIIEPALFYDRCMRLWSGVFEKANCMVRLYEPVRHDIVSDFLANVLRVGHDARFTRRYHQANERVGRDLLEFKRRINQYARDNERDIERSILRLLDKEMESRKAEPAQYQEFLPPCGRAEVLRLVQSDMERLQASYGLPPFPAFDIESANLNWSPYPGLGEERRREIERRYNRINRRVGVRLERLSLRSAGLLRRNVPGTGVILDALKQVGAKRALHGLIMGMQRGGG